MGFESVDGQVNQSNVVFSSPGNFLTSLPKEYYKLSSANDNQTHDPKFN